MSIAKPTRVRHTILALTVAAYFITYLDRVLLSNALPVIQKQFGFSIGSLGDMSSPLSRSMNSPLSSLLGVIAA